MSNQYPIWVKVSERNPDNDYFHLTTCGQEAGDAQYINHAWMNVQGNEIHPDFWLDIGPIPPLPVEEKLEPSIYAEYMRFCAEYKGPLPISSNVAFLAGIHYERTRLKEGKV